MLHHLPKLICNQCSHAEYPAHDAARMRYEPAMPGQLCPACRIGAMLPDRVACTIPLRLVCPACRSGGRNEAIPAGQPLPAGKPLPTGTVCGICHLGRLEVDLRHYGGLLLAFEEWLRQNGYERCDEESSYDSEAGVWFPYTCDADELIGDFESDIGRELDSDERSQLEHHAACEIGAVVREPKEDRSC